jgi:hypothetical protein
MRVLWPISKDKKVLFLKNLIVIKKGTPFIKFSYWKILSEGGIFVPEHQGKRGNRELRNREN